MKALGATIRQIRKERGLTINAVHYETRITHKSIANLERGVIHPRMDVIFAVCRALDVKPSIMDTYIARTGLRGFLRKNHAKLG